KRCLHGRRFRFFSLSAIGWKGTVANMVMFILGSIVSLFRCLWTLNGLKPDAVFGLGGYSSLAPVLSAFILRVPVILLEQNVIPGKANRCLSRFADLVLCHWPSPSASAYFRDMNGLHFTGTPLRKELLGHERDRAAKLFGLSPDKTTLLVLGGSQGAAAINRAVIGCLPKLMERRHNIQIIHCTGREDYLRVRHAYEAIGLEARVYDFLEDMGAAYGLADLAVSRAGASTLAELTACGIPAVLIPYPYSTDDHQYMNARELSQNGAAVLLEERFLTRRRLLTVFLELLEDKERLEGMGHKSKAMGRPGASQAVVDITLELLEKKKSGKICQDLSPQIT
ncbi:MAG: glycosyltransferase, partial [Candidatus Brocadiales bacterium]